jgi:hypothetical protein
LKDDEPALLAVFDMEGPDVVAVCVKWFNLADPEEEAGAFEDLPRA